MVHLFFILLAQLAFMIPISLPFNNSSGEGNILLEVSSRAHQVEICLLGNWGESLVRKRAGTRD